MKSVPLELLHELAGRPPESPARDSYKGISTTFDLARWLRDRGLEVKGPTEWKGGHRWVFPTCPWNPEHRNGSAFILQLPNGAIAAGCHHNGCRDKDWYALRDLVDPGWGANRHRGITTPAIVDASEWEPPMPFHHFNLPAFPSGALPDWLRAFVETLATATQTPVDLAGMLVLSVVAASCAKKVVVGLKEDYREPLNIFTVTALPPGSRKTAVFAAVTKPLEEHERTECRRSECEIARSRSALKIREAELRKLEERAAMAKGSEQEQLIGDAQTLAAEISVMQVSFPTRLLADDCTPEKLTSLLREQDGRIAVMSAEGDVFDLLAGRYSTNGAGNFVVFLKGHAGDTLRIDRMGRTEFVKEPALTVGLAVQPEVIRGLAQKPGFRGRGLLGRFLYSLPANLLGRRKTNPPRMPDNIRATYHANVLALLNIPFRKGESGDANPEVLILDPDAHASLQQFEAWVEPQLCEFAELGGITDWAGKIVGAASRIAGILHMARSVEARASWEIPISRETVENAIRVCRYLIPHAKAAFAEMGADEVVDQAKVILRWIEQNNVSHVTKRDLHQALRGTFKRVEELERPLVLLVDHEFIRKQPEASSGGPGRRPSPTYEVNPIWASQNSQNTQNPARSQRSEDCENSEWSHLDQGATGGLNDRT